MKITVKSEDELFDADSSFKRTATKFSNSSHVILPKEFVGRDIVLFILKRVLHIKKTFLKTIGPEKKKAVSKNANAPRKTSR